MFKYELAFTRLEDFIGDDGYYQLYNPNNNKHYGELRIAKVEEDFFAEYLYDWFCDMLKIAIELPHKKLIYWRYPESDRSWLEFEYCNGYVMISHLLNNDHTSINVVMSKQNSDVEVYDVIYTEEDQLTLNKYQNELVANALSYINEVTKVNDREVEELKILKDYIAILNDY